MGRGGKRRQPGWREAGKGRGAGRKGARAKKRSRGEKASKKCPNMAKRAQIASLAISRGGKKTIFATGRTSGAQKYSPEEKEKEGARPGDIERPGEIERLEEDEEGKKKRRGKARAGGTRRD